MSAILLGLNVLNLKEAINGVQFMVAPAIIPIYGSSHEGVAVLLPGFAISW